MKENIAVYESLRAHILQKESQIVNETIYMYVTYFAVLTVGSIWNSWFSLLPFFSLIVFQSMINTDQWAITKASTYIRVFFEEPRNDIHWESLHYDTFCLSVLNSTCNKTIGAYIYKWGTTTLALLSLLSILIPILNETNYQVLTIPSYEVVRMLVAFILFMVTVYVNKQYFLLKSGQGADQQLANAIGEFYRKSVNESSSAPNMQNLEKRNESS